MSKIGSDAETDSRSRKSKEILRNLSKAKMALNHTCWFLSRQLTGRRNDRRFHYRIVDGQAFIHDADAIEVEGSRKTIEKWIEIGRQLSLAKSAIWLRVGQYPKPSEEPDPRKRVRFWWWFDGIRRVFVFEATLGRKQLTELEINKRYRLHRRLWVLASQGAAIDELYQMAEQKLPQSEQVKEAFSQLGEQLDLFERRTAEVADAMHSPTSPRRSIAYSG